MLTKEKFKETIDDIIEYDEMIEEKLFSIEEEITIINSEVAEITEMKREQTILIQALEEEVHNLIDLAAHQQLIISNKNSKLNNEMGKKATKEEQNPHPEGQGSHPGCCKGAVGKEEDKIEYKFEVDFSELKDLLLNLDKFISKKYE